MNIEDQFNIIAKEYDVNRRKFIPCFDDYYVGTTDFLASQISAPKRILDLGSGTGLLPMYWYKYFPNAEYILTDIAGEMLSVAKNRFKDCANVKYEICDYSENLPYGKFDLIISALSIHHLEDRKKSQLFSEIYDKLSNGGMFVNYDQFCFDDKEFSKCADFHWENGLKKSGLSENDIQLWKERRKLDRECSVLKEISMLKDSQFKSVQCIYSYQKFSVIVSIK